MPILKPGSTGPAVQDLQQKLKSLGFDPNGVDGKFGPGTLAAVIAFQKSKGLQTDGMVGPATMAALQSAGGGATANVGGEVSGGSAGASGVGATLAPAGGLNLPGLAGKVPANVIAQIPAAASEFGITTNLRLAHFLAQCALESNNCTATVENLNYSAPRIL